MNAKHPFVLKLSIAQKLLLTASINIVFMLIIGFYAIDRINVIGTEIARIAEVDIPMATMVTSIETMQLQQSLYLERALRTAQHMAKKASAKQDYHFATDQFNQFGRQVSKTLSDSIKKVTQDLEQTPSGNAQASKQVLDSLKKIQHEHQDYQRHGSQLLNVVGAQQLDYGEHQLLFDKIEREEQHLELEIRELTERLTQFGVVAMEQSQDVEKSALHGVIMFVMAAVLLGLTISFLLIRYITQPIVQISKMTRKVAQGHIDQQIEWGGSDEIGDLATSINQLITTLNQTADQADAIAQGDFSFEIKPRSAQDRVGIALHEMKNQIFQGNRALEQSSSLNTGIVDTSQDAILTINSKGFICK
ncbi:MAG: HAMP domain-containing protein [Psychrosphaera sp.]|nr:HAMP domain-containing protein [Psychrosphaera sp.]